MGKEEQMKKKRVRKGIVVSFGANGFCDFPVLTVQSLYDVSCVHNTSDIIWKLEKGTYIFPIIFPVADSIGIFLSPFLLNVLQFR